MSFIRLLVIFWIVFVTFSVEVTAQLTCLNCSARDTTSYTNGYENDSLFFICQGQSALLRVNWPSEELINVQWYRFISSTNSWLPITNQQQVPEGSYTAANGGFRALVTNSLGTILLDDICWISRVAVAPIVNANTIQPGCSAVQLAGLFWSGNVGGYYNPPPSNFTESYFFNDSTEIEVCLDIQHPIMADLRIELVAPPECGSTTILLTEAQTPIEVDTVCYNADATNLCFNNSSQLNYYLCDLPFFEISGDFGSFGSLQQPIDWTPLEGCDVTLPGWSLNVYDCYEGAQGYIVNASITISDDSYFSQPYMQVYDPAGLQDFTIPDVGCLDSLHLSILFERNYPNAAFLGQNIGVVWEAYPPVDFLGEENELYVTLANGPQQDTYFTFSLTNIQLGEACGTTSMDVEFYDYIPPDSAVIALTDSVLCLEESPLLLTSSFEEGTWNGPIESVTDGVLFDPASAGEGEWTVTFQPNSSCIQPTEVVIVVQSTPQITFGSVSNLCSIDSIVQLEASPLGGIWTGPGVLDSLMGSFDPSLVVSENAELLYSLDGNCPTQAFTEIAIETYVPLQIFQPDTTALCLNAQVQDFASNLTEVLWFGNGISSMNEGSFDPQLAGLGLHQVVAMYHEACSSADTIWVKVEDPSMFFIQPSHECVNSDTVMLFVEAESGVWSGMGIIDSLLGIMDPVLLPPGTHFFTYSLLNSCATEDSVALTIEDFPEIDLGLPDGVCIDQPAFDIQANFFGGNFIGTAIEGPVGQQVFNPVAAGLGVTVVQYDYSDVCSITVVDTVEVFPLPELVLSADTSICPQGEALLNASGAEVYSWSPSFSVLNSQQAATVAEPSETTTYIVTGQSVNGCASSGEVTVEVFEPPTVITNGPLEICPGESDILAVSGLQVVQWEGPAIDSPQQSTTVVSPSETTLYHVHGTDEHGCVGEASAEVIVHQPLALFTASDTIGIPPFEVDFSNASVGDYFVWELSNGDTIITDDSTEIVQGVFDGEQTHTITLTAYLAGCPDVYSMQVVTYYDSELLIIPNVVTPNGDMLNDAWRVKTQNMKELDADILNRWGTRVGGLHGVLDEWLPEDNPDGTYYYRLSALGLDGEGYNQEGSFIILRSED
jgi:hypothetical protein